MSFDLSQAQLSQSIQQAVPSNNQIDVRYVKKEEVVQFGQELLNLVVLAEKVKQAGQMFDEEEQYLVIGETAQTALFNDLKIKTFIPAVNQYNEKFIAIINAPSPSGFTCGYYESAQQAIPLLQQGYGYLVNERNNQSYRFMPVNTNPYTGEFPSLEDALKQKFEHSSITNGNEDVLVRLGKTFGTEKVATTPATLPTQTVNLTPLTPTTPLVNDPTHLDLSEMPELSNNPLDELLG